MVQMLLLWLPKNPKAAAGGKTNRSGGGGGGSVPQKEGATSSTNCFRCKRLSKLMRKLKKQGVGVSSCRQRSSVQCCGYDPMSYSLNFDTSGCGSLADDRDDYYYKHYAFSSRFVANPTTISSSCPSKLQVATS